jgi:hypothetical protein
MQMLIVANLSDMRPENEQRKMTQAYGFSIHAVACCGVWRPAGSAMSKPVQRPRQGTKEVHASGSADAVAAGGVVKLKVAGVAGGAD